MMPIVTNPLTQDRLRKAWTPWITPGSACPYFELEGSLQLGRYGARVHYERCGTEHDRPPPRHAVLTSLFTPPDHAGQPQPYFVRARVVITTARGLFRRVLDWLFHDIAFDGSRSIGRRRLVMLIDLEERIRWLCLHAASESCAGRVQATSTDPTEPDGADSNTAVADDMLRVQEQIDRCNDPAGTLAALRQALRRTDPAVWQQIEPWLTVPDVVRAVWHDPALLMQMVDHCPDHAALYRLAATQDPACASPAAGLSTMIEDTRLMEGYVMPLLHSALDKLPYEQAIEALRPFRGLRTASGAQLFWRDAGKTFRHASALWGDLLHRARGIEDLVELAAFHADVDFDRYIEAALGKLSLPRLAEMAAGIKTVVSRALSCSAPADEAAEVPEITALRRLVEEVLPRFLGSDAGRRHARRRPADRTRRLDMLQHDREVPALLDQARQTVGKRIDFRALVAATPHWRWSACP